MHRLVIGSLLLLCPLQSAALADDMIYDWGGGYGGVHIGGAIVDGTVATTIPPASNINDTASLLATMTGTGDAEKSGFLGGGQIGYNFQNGNFVFGLEADASYADLEGTRNSGILTSSGFSGRTIDTLSMDFIGSVRGRLGYANDRWLWYSTAGLSFTDASVTRTLDWSFNDGCPATDSSLQRCHVGAADFDVGFVIGAGLEYGVTQNITTRIEYLYTDFGTQTFATTGVPFGQLIDHSISLQTHSLKLGLNYRF